MSAESNRPTPDYEAEFNRLFKNSKPSEKHRVLEIVRDVAQTILSYEDGDPIYRIHSQFIQDGLVVPPVHGTTALARQSQKLIFDKAIAAWSYYVTNADEIDKRLHVRSQLKIVPSEQ